MQFSAQNLQVDTICRCDIMIHTANEFTAKHRRSLLSTTTMGLDSLPAPGEAAHVPGAVRSGDMDLRHGIKMVLLSMSLCVGGYRQITVMLLCSRPMLHRLF